MNKFFIKIFFIISISLSLVTQVLAERNLSSAANFLIELQKRNWTNSVEFCAEFEPKIKSTFQNYMNNYSTGVQAGLNKIDKSASQQMYPDGKEKNTIFKMASKQGMILKKKIQSKPSVGCSRILNMLSNLTVASVEQKIVEGYDEYQRKREKYCNQVPKPENCQ